MESTLSSKVTVEYHDPSGVFPLISRDLASRLPLRNLNWKSPSRPLRSIGALHVEFLPDAETEAADPNRLQRVDSYGSRASNAPASTKERRHQIPGLRQTPYLKIYLLRCDDKDTYKTSHRQLVRDWIKENAPATQSTPNLTNTENHDACEWLILHVVIPDTTAASEPRWTAASKKDPDELVERPSNTTKWPGKSTRTVLDKIRADFTSSSKSTPERVAQIRLQKKDVPPQMVPHAPTAQPYVESPQEQDNAWQDLISKFKTLILMSFDLRVSQYEEDIREKDAQRALPGWNFCTFFTLKEGLARGFESVGLVEDALAIYDELSAGLDAALRDDEPGAARGTFLGDLDDYRNSLQHMIDASSDASKLEQLTKQFQAMFENPLDLTTKDYRGAIVSSTISLFDFRLYIFARQRTLLLRLGIGTGNVQQGRPSSSRGGPKDDNLTFAAEVCKRAALFAATNARALRKELIDGSDNNSPQLSPLVENLASSWTYAVLDQILGETASKDLPSSGSSVDMSPFQQQKHTPSMKSRKDAGGSFNFPQGANTHPTRTSSLQRSSSSSMQLSPQTVYENERHPKPSAAQSDSIPSSGSGAAVLASGRAQLFLMQRRLIEALAKEKGWQSGWAAVSASQPLADIDLDAKEEITNSPDGEVSQAKPSPEVEKIAESLLSTPLATAITSLDSFRAAYEQLSNLAVSHFTAAKHTKSADTVISDLAMLKYQLGDFAQAASYFQRSSASYLRESWSYVHGEILRIYAGCLKELHRRDEYMRVMLNLLGKVIARQRQKALPRVRAPSSWIDDDMIDVEGVLGEIVAFSNELPYNFTTPMSDFFADIDISPEITHYSDKDGFSLDLHFRHLLEETLSVGHVRLRLTLASDSSQEVLLHSDGPVELKQGLIKLKVHSNITTYGHYLIDKLVFESKKLHFTHEFQPKPQTTPLGITNASTPERRPSMSGPALLVYPHGEALDAQASLAKELYIDRSRSIFVEVETGWNDTKSLDLRLRSASAGLRLHTADAIVVEGKYEQLDTSQAGMVRLGPVGTGAKIKIGVPYTVERNVGEVTVRLEANYQTAQGAFTFLRTSTISVELPLDVDVNDIFKSQALFSKFSIRTTNAVPLQLTDAHLQESAAYEVQALPYPLPMTVFDKQPASLTYKITKKVVEDKEIDKKEAALALTIQYLRMDEVAFDKLGAFFDKAVTDSPFVSLRRLLVPTLLYRTKSWAPASQLEQAVLLGELQVPTYDTLGWDKIIASLPAERRQGLDEWLRGWHSNNVKISLEAETSESTQQRKITLSVEVPAVDILHTATLRLNHDVSIAAATVGRPLSATLTIKHTKRWASAGSNDIPLTFAYALDAPTDGPWLIAGPKRARFSITDDDTETKVSLVLVPLRPGTHLLPAVDVQPVATSTDIPGSDGAARMLHARQRSTATDQDSAQPSISCETDYRSSGETVLVVRDARTSTVTVRERERDGGPMLHRVSTATESVRASVESNRTSRVMGL